MKVFIFQFKVKPKTGQHLTIKHGHAAVYAQADRVEAAKKRAKEYADKCGWIVSSVEKDGFEYNPELHDLSDESKAIYHRAMRFGVGMAIGAVGIVPSADGSKN